MEIRLATQNDIVEIQKILEKKLDLDYFKFSNYDLVKTLVEQKKYYVLEDNGSVKGIIAVRFMEKIKSCEIITLASSIKGGGKFMINWCQNECKKRGICKMWCWSMKDFDAVGFYKKMGFTEKLLMEKQFSGRDCWILGKIVE